LKWGIATCLPASFGEGTVTRVQNYEN